MSKGPKWRHKARKNDDKYFKAKKRRRRKKSKDINSKERRERDRQMTSEYGQIAHSMCGRKLRYDSEETATKFALLSEGYCNHRIAVYQCPFCHGWHLTSNPKNLRCV